MTKYLVQLARCLSNEWEADIIFVLPLNPDGLILRFLANRARECQLYGVYALRFEKSVYDMELGGIWCSDISENVDIFSEYTQFLPEPEGAFNIKPLDFDLLETKLHVFTNGEFVFRCFHDGNEYECYDKLDMQTLQEELQ